ncbi:competence protein CoiA [Bacillaceae bacterium W0354]
MLTAIDEKGNKVLAYNKSEDELKHIRQSILFCPDCQERVILKAGQIITPHFAHKSNSTCTTQQGEGEEHNRGKLDLFNWFNEQGYPTWLEYYLPSIKQRVDLLVKLKRNYIAVEYQCAPISNEELMNRTKGLYSKGVVPIWIFGRNYLKLVKKNAIRLNTTLRSATNYFDKSRRSKLLFYNSTSRKMTVVSDLYSVKNTAYCAVKTKPLKFTSWQELFHSNELDSFILYQHWLNEKRSFRTGQRIYQTAVDRRFMLELYEHHLHPQYLSSSIHLPIKNSHQFLLPHYIWQTKIVLQIHPLRIGSKFRWIDIWNKIKNDFKRYVLVCYPTPNNHPVYQYLVLLENLGYLRRLNGLTFVKVKHFTFPKTIEQAVKLDEAYLRTVLLPPHTSIK